MILYYLNNIFLIVVQKIDDNYSASDLLWVISVIIVLALYYYFYKIKKNELLLGLKNKFIQPNNYKQIIEVLSNLFPYFKALNLDLKKKFTHRVAVFLNHKEFISRQSKPDKTVNILIAATAVQLTFGLKNFSLFTFDKILIYPTEYFSKIRQVYHKGEINTQLKLIVLSTKHFLAGIKDSKDGINLGLHEMAHALNFHTFVKNEEEFIYYFKHWERLAVLEMNIIKNKENHIFRKYASENIQEMFAVSTEVFFEKPSAFQKQLPELYKKMCMVFKQNPINADSPILKL